jgi:hemoglobin/transferrin/lactoferrin receptor protein
MNLSTGFRAPNLDDLGKVFESAPGVVVVPNPSLRPEYVYNVDLGVANDFGKMLHTEVAGFFSFLDNAMVRREFLFNGESTIIYQGEESAVYAMVNAGYAVVYGAQIKAELKPVSLLRIKTALTLTGGHDDAKAPLRHVPPVFGSTHIIFEKSAFKTDLYALYNGSKPYDKMAPAETEKPYMYASDENGNPWSPGWFTLNLKASYNLLNRAEFSAGLENMLDVRYRPYSSGIVSPGRNFIVSVRIMI